MKKIYRMASLILIGSVLLTACGGPPPLEATIEMDEYSYTPNELELEVGQEVTLTLVNVGEIDHELMIGQGVSIDSEGRPSNFRVEFFANAGVTPEISGGGTLEGNMVVQPAGSDPTTIQFTVTKDMLGTWEMGCFEENGLHYTSGMTGTITVRQ